VTYVNSILQQNEIVLRVGRVHWIVYMRPLVLAALCLLFLYVSDHSTIGEAVLIGALISGLLALVTCVRAWFWNWTGFHLASHRGNEHAEG
jgi:hypothetical protein